MYDPVILPVALDSWVRNSYPLPAAQRRSDSFPLDKIDEAFEKPEWEGKQTSVSRAVTTP